MNVEREKAYVLFEKAVDLDSSLFACHTALAIMSRGDKRENHKAMAKKYVTNENETSKLFVSLLDIAFDSTGTDQRREVWGKMHELSNGPFIHFQYATSLEDNLETIQELDKLKAILEEIGMSTGFVSNIKGYYYQLLGDLDKGTAEIDQYLTQYPDGYNPLDSRAEFYLFAGDTATAIQFYEKTLERFPFAVSPQRALDDLKK